MIVEAEAWGSTCDYSPPSCPSLTCGGNCPSVYLLSLLMGTAMLSHNAHSVLCAMCRHSVHVAAASGVPLRGKMQV